MMAHGLINKHRIGLKVQKDHGIKHNHKLEYSSLKSKLNQDYQNNEVIQVITLTWSRHISIKNAKKQRAIKLHS